MPKDKAGKYHMNPQRAHAADQAAPAAKKPPMSQAADEPMGHAGGGSIPEHLSAMHAEHGGKHMHVHHDGMNLTSHHVGDDGQVQGPHDHQNLDALKDHMSQFFDEEKQEY